MIIRILLDPVLFPNKAHTGPDVFDLIGRRLKQSFFYRFNTVGVICCFVHIINQTGSHGVRAKGVWNLIDAYTA